MNIRKIIGTSAVLITCGFFSAQNLVSAEEYLLAPMFPEMNSESISVKFNATWSKVFPIPNSIEMYVDGKLIGEGPGVKSEFDGFSLTIDSPSCTELPEFQKFEDLYGIVHYEISGDYLKFIAHYDDGHIEESSSSGSLWLEGVRSDIERDQLCASIGESLPLKDISGNIFKDYIMNLYNDEVISGTSDGKYLPQDVVTREAMSKYIFNAFDIKEDTSCGDFPDVDESNVFHKYITSLKCAGIISGYSDGTYKPQNSVKRDAVTKFVVNAMKENGTRVDLTLDHNFSDVNSSNPFDNQIAYLSNMGVIKGRSDGTYGPNEELKRDAMAKIIDLSRKI